MPSEKKRLTVLSTSATATRGKLLRTGGDSVHFRGSAGDDYVCGKCGELLMAAVDRLPAGNSALRCNGCGRFNHGSKLAKFARLPTLFEEITSLPIPAEKFTPIERVRTCPEDGVLDKIHADFVSDWGAAQGVRPHKLYHYTSLDGLKGMLGTNQVWITDVAYLNDSQEMQLAAQLIEESLNVAADGQTDLCKELLRRSRVSGSTVDAGAGYYVACFCESRDLLSQWRAYGAQGGGYAVGFSACEMAIEGVVNLRKVIYSPERQRELVQKVIAGVLDAFAHVSAGKTREQLDGDHTFPSFAQILASHLREFLVTFKHDTFSDEKEWRIVLPFSRDDHIHFLRFRNSRGQAVPYMQLHPRTPTPDLPILPIVEVVHGPTLHPELAKKSLHLLLQSTDYDHVEVGGSRSPLRT